MISSNDLAKSERIPYFHAISSIKNQECNGMSAVLIIWLVEITDASKIFVFPAIPQGDPQWAVCLQQEGNTSRNLRTEARVQEIQRGRWSRIVKASAGTARSFIFGPSHLFAADESGGSPYSEYSFLLFPFCRWRTQFSAGLLQYKWKDMPLTFVR